SELVDALRATLFGTELYASKPLGTVTFFLRGIRAATNVLTENGERAVGTRVSPQVEKEVLEHGRPWQARAWVVDSWYLSSYVPLRDKNEKIVGMLYVGLLEAPYAALRADLLVRFLIPVLVVLLFAAAASIAVVKRVSQPLEVLRHTAETIACGQLDAAVPEHKTYTEIADFTAAFRRMHQAIKERDEKLRRQNQLLSETNDSLVRANNNYMGTLGFVTHELKAPLAAMQSFIDVLERGTLGELQEPVRQVLRRIKRNCEELQDMVKNYLDLSRAEQGEFTPQMSACDFIADVVEPVVEHTSALFLSRGITLNIAAPKSIPLTGDAELLRITLTNYLSNAAKYGRENSAAELRISAANNELLAVVRNEGEGFTPGEEVNLFKKFVRLKNAASRGKRGSGLGLFLCKLAVELHGGTVSAYSEPGAWAEFSFRLPLPTAQAAGDAIR
ncbi:MAG TPA: cache domain-containing protein, partial [Oligoflexia bacterium]|nr:cache domain-containing protein [Oligoflexia bacterium]